MISEKVSQLVKDIFLQIRNPEVHKDVQKDPEAHLLSLLKEIKKDLSGDAKYRRTLHHTVECASFHPDKAKEGLDQSA